MPNVLYYYIDANFQYMLKHSLNGCHYYPYYATLYIANIKLA